MLSLFTRRLLVSGLWGFLFSLIFLSSRHFSGSLLLAFYGKGFSIFSSCVFLLHKRSMLLQFIYKKMLEMASDKRKLKKINIFKSENNFEKKNRDFWSWSYPEKISIVKNLRSLTRKRSSAVSIRRFIYWERLSLCFYT